MNLTLISLAALSILFVSAHICTFVFKIYSDKFYNPFHFLGGFFIALLSFNLSKSYLGSLMATLIIGISWEIYEWFLWKYVLKKEVFKPKKQDTINDLVLDSLGAITTILFLSILA